MSVTSASPIDTLALVLARSDYSETSQLGLLFTRDLGRVRVLAKGIKRPGADLRGPLDLFALAKVRILLGGSDLRLLTRFQVETGFPGLRARLESLFAAFYVTEVLRESTREDDPDPGLFTLVVATLATLEVTSAPGVTPVVFWFELGLLGHLGFLPELAGCVVCHRPARAGQTVRVSPGRGGIVCRQCLRGPPTGLYLLGDEARRTVAALLHIRDGAVAAALPAGPVARRQIRAVLDGILEHVLEKELRSRRFLEGS